MTFLLQRPIFKIKCTYTYISIRILCHLQVDMQNISFSASIFFHSEKSILASFLKKTKSKFEQHFWPDELILSMMLKVRRTHREEEPIPTLALLAPISSETLHFKRTAKILNLKMQLNQKLEFLNSSWWLQVIIAFVFSIMAQNDQLIKI